MEGMHTFAIYAKKSGFMIYNDDDDLSKRYTIAKDRKQVIKGRKFIIGYKLK